MCNVISSVQQRQSTYVLARNTLLWGYFHENPALHVFKFIHMHMHS